MKKTFAVIIAALTAMSFAGCDDYSEVTVAETTDTAVTETQREEETSEPAEKGNATIEETVLFDENGVVWQVGELGKVDEGGGGTVAKYVASHNIDVVDVGVPVLSMHAPYEVISKLDLYMAYKGFLTFFTK